MNESTPIMGSFGTILARITDHDLHKALQTERGGQLARAVAQELDEVRAAIANPSNSGPSRINSDGIVTDAEAMTLMAFLDKHFSLQGVTPQPNERLVNRVLMTLHALVQQLQDTQSALSAAKTESTPTK